MGEWRVLVTQEAKRHLSQISDERVRDAIKEAVRDLRIDPDQKGKPLTGELGGYRSIRVVGQRYRVIFKPEHEKVTVYVVAAGIRRAGDKADIYEVAHKLLQAYTGKQNRNRRPRK